MSPHDLSEHTKRLLDLCAGAASVMAIGLSQVAAMVSIAAGLLSIVWLGLRIYDRLKYGRSAGE
jgi:hypothetical protein